MAIQTINYHIGCLDCKHKWRTKGNALELPEEVCPKCGGFRVLITQSLKELNTDLGITETPKKKKHGRKK